MTFKQIRKYGDFVKSYNRCVREQAKTVVVGDSIAANLERYPEIWEKFSKVDDKAANMGSGGDKTEDLLRKAEKLYLPKKVEVCVMHIGINDLLSFTNTKYTALLTKHVNKHTQDFTFISPSLIQCGPL